MSIREALKKKPALLGVAGGTVVALALTFSILQQRGGGRPPLPTIPDQCFYTTDEGATLFADGLNQVPSFEHEGRQAVLRLRVHLRRR